MAFENKELGENIKRIRTDKNFTQQDVAKKVGVTPQTVCKIEKSGRTNAKTLERIASALHVDVRELYEPQKETHYERCTDFINDDEMKIFFSDYARPLIMAVNDTVAQNFYKKIKEKCMSNNSKRVETAIQESGIKAEVFTRKDVGKICYVLCMGILSEIGGILKEYD